jgi:hypothetical protein
MGVWVNMKFLDNLRKTYEFDSQWDKDFWKTIILNFIFNKWKLIEEKSETLSHFEWMLNHDNLSILSEFEQLLLQSFNEWFISDKFNDFLIKNKENLWKYVESKIYNIISNIKIQLFSIFLKDTEDEYRISEIPQFINLHSISKFNTNDFIGTKKEGEINILKKEYIKKNRVLNILLANINPTIYDWVKNSTLEIFKELNTFFANIKD